MPARNATCALITIRKQRDYQKPRNIDYASFVNRVSFVRQRVDPEVAIRARYERASHSRQIIADRQCTRTQTVLETCLHEHIERWKTETIHWSSITRRLAHPSYLRIIGLAKDFSNHEVERALLREFQTDPDHWFAALTAITGINPVRSEDDFDKAMAAWLAWGQEEGII